MYNGYEGDGNPEWWWWWWANQGPGELATTVAIIIVAIASAWGVAVLGISIGGRSSFWPSRASRV